MDANNTSGVCDGVVAAPIDAQPQLALQQSQPKLQGGYGVSVVLQWAVLAAYVQTQFASLLNLQPWV